MTLKEIYHRCVYMPYTHVENDGDYALEKIGDTLYIYFQCSYSKIDWKNNFDFPARPYSDMGTPWKAHRGFLRVWKSIKPYIADAVKDETVKKIYVVGYSMGAAIATFCHEYVWFNRPDLRENGLEGYGFGCPRVYWGFMKKELKERWEHFHPIRNCGDIVTHVPPALFGYRHVNKVYELKNKELKEHPRLFKCVDAHMVVNYEFSLEQESEETVHDGKE